ncbi:MAG: hypothetical protein IPI13_02580 [Actinomycetales bacterium]|jgi:hypothetical protein|uniref:Thiazolylpeptide-type bacteriocin n=1 Tax=Candidatus Phosphoribacter hodrii TaxID=2953743 RepID=A0A935IT82_9MICO|nr:hypothetical protein [Candidatus Phosphoribacter hodrii]HOV01552.1 hypothetical protein [Dermatophilaceae bacterium]MBK7272077.1 hypothetical protein [Candidatus Phosphoribacter hodrii]HPV79482.1 hypothetical protein [Dermatophilaceae bacterium]HQG11339.1 hypothetical protein [Dermatophilaceae bacterium]
MNRSTEVELVDEMFSIEELEQRETPGSWSCGCSCSCSCTSCTCVYTW